MAWADWADIGLGEEPIIILCSDKRGRNTPGRRQWLPALMALNQLGL